MFEARSYRSRSFPFQEPDCYEMSDVCRASWGLAGAGVWGLLVVALVISSAAVELLGAGSALVAK
jgi:hypothetical protein